MSGALGQKIHGTEDDVVDWFNKRNREASVLRSRLEHAGREYWNNATRAGTKVVARTTQELQALGTQVLNAREQGPVQSSSGPISQSGTVTPRPRATAEGWGGGVKSGLRCCLAARDLYR